MGVTSFEQSQNVQFSNSARQECGSDHQQWRSQSCRENTAEKIDQDQDDSTKVLFVSDTVIEEL